MSEDSPERGVASVTLDEPQLRDLRDEARTLSIAVAGVVDYGAASSTGLVRTDNEDSWVAEHPLFFVADGMGGLDGGRMAADTAIRSLQTLPLGPHMNWESLVLGVDEAVRQRREELGVERLGTTLSGIVVRGDFVTVVNVGDSRVYRTSAGKLDLLTRDHTVRTELMDAGMDPSAQATEVSLRSLTSYIGGGPETALVDVVTVVPRQGDRFLVCTDGVHGQMLEPDLAHLMETGDCAQAASALVRRADSEGGRDNATAIVIEFGRSKR